MADSNASARRLLAAERRTQALGLRKAGCTFAQIGQALGCSEQRAHKIVTQELARLNVWRAEQAAEVTRLELERLDVMFFGVWRRAQGGETAAIDTALKVMARRAKLLGLDAAEKKVVQGDHAAPVAIQIIEEVIENDAPAPGSAAPSAEEVSDE